MRKRLFQMSIVTLLLVVTITGSFYGQYRKYNRYVNPYNRYYQPYDYALFNPWLTPRYQRQKPSYEGSRTNPWQMEDPVKREVYEALRREASAENNNRHESVPFYQEDIMKNPSYGLHSIPGLSSPTFYQDENLEQGAENYGWDSRFIDSLPQEDNYNGPIWNEDGKYWGYPQQSDYTTSMSQDGLSNQVFTAFDENDKSCVPPFCIPIQCNSHEEGGCNKKRDCEKSNCNRKCYNGGVCNNDACCCKSGYMGSRCEVMKREKCSTYYRLSCEIGCVTQEEPICVCNPWKVKDIDNCKVVELDIFECPEGCNGRGTCNKSTKECKCYSGYHGRACEKEDYCSSMSCSHGCVNEENQGVCTCSPGQVLASDRKTCIGRDGVDNVQRFCRETCKHGTCTEDGLCRCEDGYRGESCQEDIDECLNGNICEAKVCVNTPGSYECKCEQGLTGAKCDEDLNECDQSPGVCDHICINTFKSFKCECYPGYMLSEKDKKTCRKTNSCSVECLNGLCDTASGTCKCYPGFRGDDCSEDVDECADGTHKCSQKCVNTYGNYKCECFERNMKPDPNNLTMCIRTGCPAKCINGICDLEYGQCQCYEGYTGIGCRDDIDECATGRHKCEQICINEYGSYSCQCRDGFMIDLNDPYKCLKRDCPVNCINGECDLSTQTCRCNEGYGGESCGLDIDECSTGEHACEQTCINTMGSYRCGCNTGYHLSTVDLRSCLAELSSSCSPPCVHGECGLGNRCQCLSGYTGHACEEDIDECSTGQHTCQHTCVNFLGGYRCECRQGYYQSPMNSRECIENKGVAKTCNPPCVNGQCDERGTCQCYQGYMGPTCNLDFDECTNGQHTCEQICMNRFGSYQCACEPGYLLVNETDCRRIDKKKPACNPACINGKCVGNRCECYPGYSGPGCTLNENVCETRRPCEQICDNLGGGRYACRCHPGYEPYHRGDHRCRPLCRPGIDCIHGRCNILYLNARNIDKKCNCNPGWGGTDCDIDINECMDGTHKCSEICINEPGTYSCACSEGNELQPDGFTCFPKASPNDCNGGCLNGGSCLLGNKCRCLHGFRGDRCEERIDFCKEQQPCQHQCYNTADPTQGGGYRCSCNEGYELENDGKSCSLAKQCNRECENNGRCYQGRCLCAPGFTGVFCEEDVNECGFPFSIHKCQHKCLNTFGSYECECSEDFFRLADRKTCVRKKPDFTCNPPCKNGGRCQQGNLCECRNGFEGADCTSDIDECERKKPCAPDISRCRNLYGGFQCICNEGYVLMRDSVNCMTHAEARLHPDLVHRGKSQKGIVLGKRLDCPECVEAETNPTLEVRRYGRLSQFRSRKRF